MTRSLDNENLLRSKMLKIFKIHNSFQLTTKNGGQNDSNIQTNNLRPKRQNQRNLPVRHQA
jgi:hypothetical protein